MKTVIVLAMHGQPASDFPNTELHEFMDLHQRLHHAEDAEREALKQRLSDLDFKIRQWPRTPETDPFLAASEEIASHLTRITGLDAVVGFNELCAPNIDEAIESAIAKGGERVLVVTPMMTPGGEHSEEDIPAAISRVSEKHPEIEIQYAWPFEPQEISQFLSDHLNRFL